jgi:lactose/L-arabinose transport system substrate-binding protein
MLSLKKVSAMAISLTLLIVVLFGCSGVSANRAEAAESELSGEYTVWVWDMALQSLEDTAKLFAKIHPKVKLKFEMTSSEHMLMPALVTGQGLPDIVAFEGEQFSRFASKFPKYFADFTEFINTAEFLPNKIAEVKIDGKLLGMPWDAAPVALFYRQDIMDKAGVNMAEVKTYDDFIAAGIKVKEKTGMAMLPMATSNNDFIYRQLLMQQNSFYFDNAGKPILDSEVSLRSMEVVKKMYDAGITFNFNDWSEYVASFTQGKVACVMEAVWILGSMKLDGPSQSGNWRVRELPQINGSNGVASNGGAALAVTSTQKDRTAAIEFVKFAMTNMESQLNGFVTWGLYPSYIPSYSAPIFSEPDEYCGGQKIYELFNQLATNIPSVNYTENYEEAKDVTKNAVSAVFLEGKAPSDVLAEAQQELKNKLGM